MAGDSPEWVDKAKLEKWYYEDNLSQSEIGELVDRHQRTVCYWFKKLGIESKYGGKGWGPTDWPDRARFTEMIAGGMNLSEMGDEIGVSAVAVRNKLGELGIQYDSQTGKARRHLSCDEVECVRRKYRDTDLSYKSLADEHGVSAPAIGMMVRGKTYKDCGGPIKGEDC